MKIISKPDVSGWKYSHKCSKCDSQLEVYEADLTYHKYDGDCREPGYETYFANCVVCKNSFTIPNNDIPKLIKINVKEKYTRSTTRSYMDK